MCCLCVDEARLHLGRERHFHVDDVQMGGPEGVRASEHYTLVIGLGNGMSMHAIPRPGVM